MVTKEFSNNLITYFGASQSSLFEILEDTKPKDVTQIQYNILEYLYFKEAETTSNIAHCMYLSMPNTSRELKKLLAKDYIVKVIDKTDKRKYYISLSNEGRILMDDVMKRISIKVSKRYEHLSNDSQDKIIEALNYIKKELFF